MSADDLAARLRLVAEHVGPACSVFLAVRDEPILYGYELADAADEIDRLQRWKAEAVVVLDGWERVWEVLGKPGVLGSSKYEASEGRARSLVEEERDWALALRIRRGLEAERDRLREAGDALAAACRSVGQPPLMREALDRWEQTR